MENINKIISSIIVNFVRKKINSKIMRVENVGDILNPKYVILGGGLFDRYMVNKISTKDRNSFINEKLKEMRLGFYKRLDSEDKVKLESFYNDKFDFAPIMIVEDLEKGELELKMDLFRSLSIGEAVLSKIYYFIVNTEVVIKNNIRCKFSYYDDIESYPGLLGSPNEFAADRYYAIEFTGIDGDISQEIINLIKCREFSFNGLPFSYFDGKNNRVSYIQSIMSKLISSDV